MRFGYGQFSPLSPRDEQHMRLIHEVKHNDIRFDDKWDSKQTALQEAIYQLAHSRGERLLVVCSLSRLASSITSLLEISARLQEHRIALVSLAEKVTILDNKIFFAADDLTRFRKENAADKSMRGTLVAEKRGRQTGRRPALTQAKLELALKELAKGAPFASVAKNAGVSVPTLYRYRAAYNRE